MSGGAPWLAALLLQTGEPPTVRVTLEESVSTEYYDLNGRSERELSAALERRSLMQYLGQTDLAVSSYFGYRTENGLCHLESVSLHLSITFIYPRWVEEAQGRNRTRQTWRRFLDALEVHEEGHAEIARRGLAIIAEEASRTPPASRCEDVDAALNAQLRELWARVQRSQRDYDQQTRRGRTQGAWIQIR